MQSNLKKVKISGMFNDALTGYKDKQSTLTATFHCTCSEDLVCDGCNLVARYENADVITIKDMKNEKDT